MREEGAGVVGVYQIVAAADAVEAGVDVEEGEDFKLDPSSSAWGSCPCA